MNEMVCFFFKFIFALLRIIAFSGVGPAVPGGACENDVIVGL